MSDCVMAVDPGGKTGYAVVQGPKNWDNISSTHAWLKHMKDKGQLHVGTVRGQPEQQAQALYEIADDLMVDILVIEGFHLDPPMKRKVRTDDILLPIKVGYSLSSLWFFHYGKQVYWPPSSQMYVITEERLRRWGLWEKDKDARAALRHLLVFLRGS